MLCRNLPHPALACFLLIMNGESLRCPRSCNGERANGDYALGFR